MPFDIRGSIRPKVMEHVRCTKEYLMERVKKPISLIWQVIKSRTEGQGLNATARIFDVSKNTILDWEGKFSDLHKVLLIYALTHQFLQLVIEGDEVYTRVNKNVPADQSPGWTILLIDRASRFIWELKCGKKDERLFKKVIRTLEKLINKTQDLTILEGLTCMPNSPVRCAGLCMFTG